MNVLTIAITLICVCSATYLLCALLSVELFNFKRKRTPSPASFQPAITVLKPVHGLDPELLENLRSFCRQDYPEYQIIFGTRDKDDPAIAVIGQVIAEFPELDVTYVVDERIYGANYKVSNLVNMMPAAKFEYLLVADSDMRVPVHYLSEVIAPFADPAVGAVTCLYAGSARGKIASSLNAMFINEWFFPSVLISRHIQPLKFCLGATMVVRREILQRSGGFEALAVYLADDYMLGKAVFDLGYKIRLANVIVENVIEEASFKSLFLHELRWARTLRRVEPLSYLFTFLTDTLVLVTVAAVYFYAVTGSALLSLTPVVLTVLMRISLHIRTKQVTGVQRAGAIWLIPARDLLSFCIRMASFAGTSIRWRDNAFTVERSGVINGAINTEGAPAMEANKHGPGKQSQAGKADKIADLAASQDY